MATAQAPAGVAQLTVLLASWRIHLEAANLSATTIRRYTDDAASLARFLADHGMPTAAGSIRREHVEASPGRASRERGIGRPPPQPL